MVISYLELRKGIGSIAIALPLMLVAGKHLFEKSGIQTSIIQTSISAYYHTLMRDVLVGSLWAIAIFLLSYRGYERRDDLAGDLASLFAIGVALFPSAPESGATVVQEVGHVVHFSLAAGLFLVLAYFCLVLFRKGETVPTPRKILRNRVYTVCGYLILACIASIGIYFLLSKLVLSEDSPIRQASPVFWLEAIAIWAFGWSWFTKGEGILKDREE